MREMFKYMANNAEYDLSEMSKHITSGAISSLYLFYGEEDYFKDFYINKIKDLTVGDDVMNTIKLDGRISSGDLRDYCDTIPMLGEKKLIIVRNSGACGCGKDDDFSFLTDLPEHTHVVFKEEKADKRSKLYKICLSSGIVFECKAQNDIMIGKLLFKAAKNYNREISKGAIELMILGIGSNLIDLLTELDKLVLLTEEGEQIGEDHVRKACFLSVSARIFDLTDGISENNKDKAFHALTYLLDSKEPAQLILAMIGRQYTQLYNVKQLLDSGVSQRDISIRMGVHEFVGRKLSYQCKNFSKQSLKDRIDFCLKMDDGIKNGRIKDIAALELIVSM